MRVRLAGTAIHVVKATRELGGSVTTTTAERRELTREEEDRVLVAEAFTAEAVPTAVEGAHIGN